MSKCPNSSILPWISQDILLHEQIWHLLGSAAAAYAAQQHNDSNTNCSSEERLTRLWSLEEISVSRVGLSIAREPIHAVVWHELARIYMDTTYDTQTMARLFWEDTYKLCAPFGYTARLRSLYHCLHGAGHAAWRVAGSMAHPQTWDWRFCEPYRVGVLPSGPEVHDNAVNSTLSTFYSDLLYHGQVAMCAPTSAASLTCRAFLMDAAMTSVLML